MPFISVFLSENEKKNCCIMGFGPRCLVFGVHGPLADKNIMPNFGEVQIYGFLRYLACKAKIVSIALS